MTYKSKLKQFWRKRPRTGTAHVGVRFGVHRERAKGHETHAMATKFYQCWKGIDYGKEVIEVPEYDDLDVEVIDGCKCREKSWGVGMKRDVL